MKASKGRLRECFNAEAGTLTSRVQLHFIKMRYLVAAALIVSAQAAVHRRGAIIKLAR